ncbi:MAG: DNA polymerase III subunit alpha [Lysobacteraceae bacterium]|jgi:DNA polymerase-3 subunit alpha|nr:DNA polymerase III subunit alpha [Silanimonas sp.]
MPPRYVHLNVHSEYALTDSTIRLPELAKRSAQRGQPAIALTDPTNLFGLVKFYKEAEGKGLKPVAGAQLLLDDGEQRLGRVTTWCLDRRGYLALSRLITRAYADGQRGDALTVHPDWLFADHEGLLLALGPDSPLGSALAGGRDALAAQWFDRCAQAFDDRLYVELQRVGKPGEEAFNRAALALAAAKGVPAIATNAVRFLDRDDFDAHEARVCIATGRVLDDPKRPRDFTAEQYLKSTEEMEALFHDLPDALANTVDLAARCNFALSLGTYYLPAFPVPDGETLDTWIRSEAERGLAKRLASHDPAPGLTAQDYADRLTREVDVIIKMGFPGYFLIVADFINWGKQNGIPVGPGRGSGAGSLVAYALGITDLDPLAYNLLFERFLNPERVSMPDFDIDFCMDRRDEVIDYVSRKYGSDRVSQIITYGTMAAKAVVRDCGRVLGHPYGFVDGVAKLIPNVLGIGLDDALGETEKGKTDDTVRSSELIERYEKEDDVRDLIDLARQLEDLTRNAGKHAGGVVIAPTPLTDFCPLFSEPGGKGAVTQFDKDDVEAIGLVKFDFLGLRTLTIIDWAVKAINKRRAEKGEAPLDIARIPLDDRPTFDLFSRAQTVAVFQFESSGMRNLLREARPDRFEDLIALVSLFRPGPMDLIPTFNARKHGKEAVEYPDPRVEPVLKETYGIMVYQEQVMQMAQVLGGYSLGGADLLRRAMGKKKPEEMAKHRAMFREGAAKNGIDEAKADAVFDLMEKFAGYGFNKSHAAAYALVSYQTAWLKTHHPAEFMAAVLSSDMDNTDKVVNFLEETRAMQLTVLPPKANASATMFEATDARTIRYGLGAIKGVGTGLTDAIVQAREAGGPFRDLLDFCQRVDATKMNRRAVEAMVNAGALDGLAPNRASLLLQLPEAMKASEQAARAAAVGQVSLFGGFAEAPVAKVDLPACDEWPLEQLLAGERETLGHYLSGHPIDPWRAELADLVPIHLGEVEATWAQRKDRRGEATMILAGLVGNVRKRGDAMAFAQMDDGHGQIELAFFREACTGFAHLLSRDRILIVEGQVGADRISGALSMRVKQAWDFKALLDTHARMLAVQVDARGKGRWEAVEALLSEYRPGPTPLRLDLTRPGAAGQLDVRGRHGVRVAADLLSRLRRLPGVSAAKLALHKPWLAG